MDYQEKYLKYKQKYLLLKKMQGGSKGRGFNQGRGNGQGRGFNQGRDNGQGRGNTVVKKSFEKSGKLIQVPGNGKKLKTQHNSGSLEGMSNQCFWISILHHLRKNGHPNLTLRELRDLAGLDFSTERTMFDSSIESFRLAAERICVLFDLQITLVPINRNGIVLFRGDIVEILGSGTIRLTIAQFGIYHFELVLEDSIGQLSLEPQVPFKPLVNVKGNLTELDSLNQGTQQLFEDLHSLTQEFFALKESQESKEKRYTELLEQKDQIKGSSAYDNDEKSKFLTILDQEIDDLVKSFLNSKINDIEYQIITLQSLINEL